MEETKKTQYVDVTIEHFVSSPKIRIRIITEIEPDWLVHSVCEG